MSHGKLGDYKTSVLITTARKQNQNKYLSTDERIMNIRVYK